MANRFYVRDDEPRFATREEAERFAEDVATQMDLTGALDATVRVGEVVPRREREARDALVVAALAWIDAMSHGGTVTEVMAYCRSLATLNKATHAYRKAVST
jgi:hypothetical protein